jgi:hypothetical protein
MFCSNLRSGEKFFDKNYGILSQFHLLNRYEHDFKYRRDLSVDRIGMECVEYFRKQINRTDVYYM